MDKLNDVTKEFFNQIFEGIKNYLGVEKLNIIITEIIDHSNDISNTMINISKIIADIFIKNNDSQIITIYDDENSEIDNNIENYNNSDYLSYYNSNLNEAKKAIFEELCEII